MKAILSCLRSTLASLTLAMLCCGAVHAAETTASPGFYKISLGSMTIVALSDGTFLLPANDLMVETHKGEVQAALAKAHLSEHVPTSINAFLIDTGTKRILVDAGFGAFGGPSAGELRKHLEEAGYKPDQIDEVLITHLHADHVGGLVDSGGMVYPNATVRVNPDELRFWEDQGNASKVDASARPSFEAVAKGLNPYEAAGRVKTIRPGESAAPGVTAIDETGHTAGHTGYRVESEGKVLVVWGDVILLGLVQFPDPKATIKFDTTPAKATAVREKTLSDAANGGYLVAASHTDFPGIGTVGRSGAGFTWMPLVPPDAVAGKTPPVRRD